MKKLLLAGVAFVAMLPMTAAARARVGVLVAPAFVPYGWYGWYGPYYGMYPYGPYVGMYAYGPHFGVPNAGEVKLDTKEKDAEVYINGNYAGTVGELKTMTMRSGDYSIEIRAPGRAAFHEDIHVIAGKTMKLRPDLPVQNPPAAAGS